MTGPTEADRQKVSDILGPRLHTLILTALWENGRDREEMLDYTERQIKERIAQALCDVRDAERKRLLFELEAALNLKINTLYDFRARGTEPTNPIGHIELIRNDLIKRREIEEDR